MTSGADRAARRLARGAPLFALLLLLAPLLGRSSWPPDETRYADVARAAATRVSAVPQLHGQVYAEKPPLPFWLGAAAIRLGVPEDRALRLVAGAAGVACVAAVPSLAAGLGLAPAAGARGAWVLATTPLFLVHAQLGMLDALLTAWLAGAAWAKLRRRGAGAAGWVAAEAGFLGAALLTKGPVALLFPLGLRLGALGAAPGHPARPDRSDLAALAGALALAGLWLAAAGAEAGPGYLRALVIDQVGGRVAGDVPHPAPPGELLLVGFAWLLPWSVLALGALGAGPRRELAPVLGWLGLPWIVLALLPSQQVQYLLPAAPALALAAGACLGRAEPRFAPAALALGAGLLAAALLAFAAAPGVFLASADSRIRELLVSDAALRAGLAALAGVLAGAALARRAPLGLRAGMLAAGVFAGAVWVCVRADTVLSGAPVFREPVLAEAPRVLAPKGLRSAVVLGAGRARVDHLKKEELDAELARDPGLVALVWEKHLDRLPPDAAARLEPVARGWVMGRSLQVLRAPPAGDGARAD